MAALVKEAAGPQAYDGAFRPSFNRVQLGTRRALLVGGATHSLWGGSSQEEREEARDVEAQLAERQVTTCDRKGLPVC